MLLRYCSTRGIVTMSLLETTRTISGKEPAGTGDMLDAPTDLMTAPVETISKRQRYNLNTDPRPGCGSSGDPRSGLAIASRDGPRMVTVESLED